MRVLRPSNEDEMVWLFLRGELDSERYGPRIRRSIDERVLLEPDLEDEGENALRRAALTTLRGYESREGLFHGFPGDVLWTWAELEPDDVLEIHYWRCCSAARRGSPSGRAGDQPTSRRAATPAA